MKESFERLYELMKKNHKYSNWVQQTSLKNHAIELQKEVQELIEAVEKEDYKNFREELGDVLWDTLKLVIHAENEGWFKIKEMMEETHEKISRRKPFILEKREVTLDEEWKIWNEAKTREKQSFSGPRRQKSSWELERETKNE